MRVTRTHPACIYWKGDRALRRGEKKKTVRKTSWRNRLGKKHGILSGRRSATSTFLIQDSFQAISILAKAAYVCAAATLHPNITPRRNSAVASVTGVVNTTKRRPCVSEIIPTLLRCVCCRWSAVRRTEGHLLLQRCKMTDVSPLPASV